jgi:PAS domain-containing protein
VRFYAGAPIRLSSGHCVGTLCVIDHAPRQLDATQREILRCLAVAAAQALESRQAALELRRLAAGQADPQLPPPEPTPARLHAVVEDLALRQRAEGFLARTGRVAGVGGWEYDLQTQEVTWSEGIRQIYGVGPDFVPALDAALEPFAPQGRQAIREAMQRAMAGGPGWDLELPLRRADGAVRWVRTVGAQDVEGGRPARCRTSRSASSCSSTWRRLPARCTTSTTAHPALITHWTRRGASRPSMRWGWTGWAWRARR